ncbi:PAS domain S-box protein [Beggiatoa leptomitoformis]|uniref:Sensor protein FixL n=1 Tax=Beggiatoa leptomitoformis TaxID=288004 RepID=A0A2N9YB97_9GAMM|nr:PAS domain S-box protein [Beggiatoa leptomitoformis]AUI67731.2 PAS domain S-box protein [Beggiatoa leptomitoformis]QGX03512.1 PAS domain S-box protein [Beggiatoa leptomitoformis]
MHSQFASQIERIEHAIQEKMANYQAALLSRAGLFASSETITLGEWRNYLRYLDVNNNNYLGIKMQGYAPYILGAKKETYLAQVRANTFPYYMIQPTGERDEYAPILYIDPPSDFMKLLGYDLLNDPQQQLAIHQARDTGLVTLSAYQVANPQDEQYSDFIIYLPIYQRGASIKTRADRQSALAGLLLATFKLQDVMDSVLTAHTQQIAFKLYQVTNNTATTLLYQSAGQNTNAGLVENRYMYVHGQTWLFTFTTQPSFDALFNSKVPSVLLAGGVIVSFLLLLVAWSLINTQHLLISLRHNKLLVDKANTSLQQFKTILDMTVDSVFISDPNTLALIYVNQSAINEFGFSEAELMQMLPNQLAVNYQIDNFKVLIHPLLTGEQRALTQQGMMYHKTGRLIPVEATLQYIHQPEQTGHIVSIVRNISKQKKNEEMLRKQEEILRCVIDSIPQMVFWKDREYRFLGCNQVVAQLAKCHPRDIVGKTDDDMPWRNQAEYYRQLDQQVMESNTAQLHIIETVVTAEGAARWLETNKIPLHDTDNNVIGMLGTAEDITERLLAEQRLQETNKALQGREQQLRAIFETAGEAIVVINNYGIIESCNPAVEKMFDYATYELINKNIIILMMPEYAEKHDGYLQHYRETGEHCIIGTRREVIGRRKDGTAVPLIISVGEFEVGDQQKFAGILHDISDIKQQQTELQQAKNAAEFANYAKSTFLANMSHELRTPLNGILGYAQILLKDNTLTDEQRDGVNIILHSGDYLLTLINDVLDLAKVEANKVEIAPVEFDLQEFLSSIVDLFTVRARQKNIVFTYQAVTQQPQGIKADEKRLRQILLNLLSNAIKFTEQGHVILKIGYDEQQFLRFQIEDTGVGIAEQDLEHIFQPFRQTGEQRFKAQGTGLGLTITKRLVEMMGGELHVDSQLGQGSTFWFALQLPSVTLVNARDKVQPRILGYTGQRRRLLVVDDKEQNRQVLSKLLKPLGFEIFEAENGEDAIKQAIALHPDLIFTNLAMPIMDGLTAVRHLKTLPDFYNTPIVAVSASVFERHQVDSKQAGCTAFIPQPVRENELLSVLQTQLQLVWDYEVIVTDAETQDVFDAKAIIPLSAELAHYLHDLAMMGDLNGLFDKLDEIEVQEHKLRPFVRHAREMVKEFQLDELANLIQPYMG